MKRKTRIRKHKGRHSDRQLRASMLFLKRAMLANIYSSQHDEHRQRRPAWLRTWVQKQLGFEVADAYLLGEVVHVQTFGTIETVSLELTFTR